LSRVERRDNAARGLDSASAVEFCKSLRTQCDVVKASTCVAIHQAPQAAYETFDRVPLLYKGRPIYSDPSRQARGYFERLGFDCPASQTTPDFLTSMTSSSERRVRAGCENTVPRSAGILLVAGRLHPKDGNFWWRFRPTIRRTRSRARPTSNSLCQGPWRNPRSNGRNLPTICPTGGRLDSVYGGT